MMDAVVHQPGSMPYPGTCCVCGSGEAPCLDVGITRDWDGVVLLCVNCFKFLGTKFGWTESREAYLELRDSVVTLTLEQNTLQDVMTGMLNDIHAVVESFDSRITSAVGSSADSVPDTEDSEGADEASRGFSWLDEPADELTSK